MDVRGKYVEVFKSFLKDGGLWDSYVKCFTDFHHGVDLDMWLERVVPEHYVSGAFPWMDNNWELWEAVTKEWKVYKDKYDG